MNQPASILHAPELPLKGGQGLFARNAGRPTQR
ncbi:hypothetical protein X772_11995 [Mesorhizobium sp. LSJC280B00]|nr:hypothetical protein X772_11995 [Mesorhizobium sp. LSJC280B00]